MKTDLTIVKPKQTGSCGRGIRNEHMSNMSNYTNMKCYGTNSIYLLSILYAILYYPSQKKTARIWKFGIVDDGLKLRLHNRQFVLVLL